MDAKLSPHFSLQELLRSDTASLTHIDEQFTPPDSVIENLKMVCIELLEPLREKISEKLGKDTPIHITSAYRCPRLNQAVGGVPDSQHVTGNAVDTHVTGMSIEDWYQFIKTCGVDFDQCLQEFDKWAHISYKKNNRKECWRYATGKLPKKDS